MSQSCEVDTIQQCLERRNISFTWVEVVKSVNKRAKVGKRVQSPCNHPLLLLLLLLLLSVANAAVCCCLLLLLLFAIAVLQAWSYNIPRKLCWDPRKKARNSNLWPNHACMPVSSPISKGSLSQSTVTDSQ